MGDYMKNKCAICDMVFDHWTLYIEHEALAHVNKPIPSQSPFEEEKTVEGVVPFASAFSSGRSDLAKQEWKGCMPKKEKDRIVGSFESKLPKGVLIQ